MPQFFGALTLLGAISCQHPAERALEGQWFGQGVENFDSTMIAQATGWARGTSLEFSGTKVTVTVPGEEPKTGAYRLVAVEDRRVDLLVLDANGEQSDLSVFVDDAETLRWSLGEGRTMVLHRQ